MRPDIVFYNAGVDPHVDDRLGRLALTDSGLEQRDMWIIDKVRSTGIPLAGVIGGGYSHDIDALAGRHATLHRAAARFV
jgi:acetoin utilization deacetylase AcuC-like enzyme